MVGLRRISMLAVSAALGLSVAACGGDDNGNDGPSEPDTAVTPAQLEAVQLGWTKGRVFNRLDATPVSQEVRRGTKKTKSQKKKPPLYTCYRFGIEGGVSIERHYASLCFKKDRILGSVFSRIPDEDPSPPPAAPGIGGDAPTPGEVPNTVPEE